MIRVAAFVLAACAGSAGAVELTLPSGARLVADRGGVIESYELPIDGALDRVVPTRRLEGVVKRQSWRVDSAALTTLQLLAPLRTQLDAAGFQAVYECEAATCGGFDFRFGIEVIPSPDMYVDIRDYRFVSALRGDEAVSLLVSRSRTAGFIQVITVSAPGGGRLLSIATPEAAQPVVQAGTPPPAETLAAQLLTLGHAELAGLTFASGAAALSEGRYDSLRDLAEFLTQNPGATIALVGHTDATGPLQGNIAISLQRAQSVRERLISAYGIAASRLSAEGMGYLAPRDTNLTEAGRTRNRRVEAVLLTLE